MSRWILMLTFSVGMSGAAWAGDSRQEPGTLHRVKQHEQDFEKKVTTERDKPDKEGRARKFGKHVEENIKELGQEIQGVAKEAGAASKDESRKAKADVKAKKKTQAAETKKPPSRDGGLSR